jgi:hypothetical protein
MLQLPRSPPATTTVEELPKPRIILIIAFENGTTKAIRSDSTNLQDISIREWYTQIVTDPLSSSWKRPYETRDDIYELNIED